MITEFKSFFIAFREGKELVHATTWKNRTLASNALVAFLGAAAVIAKGFGYDFNLDQETISAVGAGIAAFVTVGNSVMHVITSKKVGLSSDSESGSPTGLDALPGAGGG